MQENDRLASWENGWLSTQSPFTRKEYVLHSPQALALICSCLAFLLYFLFLDSVHAIHLTNMDTLALINLWFAPEPDAVDSKHAQNQLHETCADVSMHWVKPFCIFGGLAEDIRLSLMSTRSTVSDQHSLLK